MAKNKTIVTELQVNIKNALAAVNELESSIRDIGLKGHLEKGLLQQIQRVRNKGTGLLGSMITMSDTSADMAKLMTEFEKLRGSVGLLNDDLDTLSKTKLKFANIDLKGDDVEKYRKKVDAATKAWEKLDDAQKVLHVKGAASAELKDRKVRVADMGVENPKKIRDQLASAMAKQARATARIDTEGKSAKELNQELNAVNTVLKEIKEQREQNLQTIYEENKVTEEQVANYIKLLEYAKEFQDGQKGEQAGKARRGFTNTAKKLGADFSSGNSDEKKLDFLSQLTASNPKLVEVASLVTEADRTFETFRNTVEEATTTVSGNLQGMKDAWLEAYNAQKGFEAKAVEKAGEAAKGAASKVGGLENSLKNLKNKAESASDSMENFEKTEGFFSKLKSHISAVFDLASVFQYFQQAVRSATQTISELDAAFTEIAVVTDMTSEELWQSFDTYNDMAQQLGTTTKDAIETSALYYQQGKPKPYLL